jgi:hypothetical protein
MAATVAGHVYKMVQGDVLDHATFNANASKTVGAYKVRASLISISSGAGGACVLTNAGVAIFTFTMAANTMYQIVGCDPLELDDFTVTTLAAGYVIVFMSP